MTRSAPAPRPARLPRARARSPRPERIDGARVWRLASSAVARDSVDGPPAPPRRVLRREWVRRPANAAATTAAEPRRVLHARPPRTAAVARHGTRRAWAGPWWAGAARPRRCASQDPRQLGQAGGPGGAGQHAPPRRRPHRPRGLRVSLALAYERRCLGRMAEGQHFSPHLEGVRDVLVVLGQIAAAVAGEIGRAHV